MWYVLYTYLYNILMFSWIISFLSYSFFVSINNLVLKVMKHYHPYNIFTVVVLVVATLRSWRRFFLFNLIFYNCRFVSDKNGKCKCLSSTHALLLTYIEIKLKFKCFLTFFLRLVLLLFCSVCSSAFFL